MGSETLVERFHAAMLESAEQCKGIDPLAEVFKVRIEKEGGLETAQRLVRERGPQPGLINLWEAGLLEVSVEALMLLPEFAELFNAAELAEARRRLERMGYAPD